MQSKCNGGGEAWKCVNLLGFMSDERGWRKGKQNIQEIIDIIASLAKI